MLSAQTTQPADEADLLEEKYGRMLIDRPEAPVVAPSEGGRAKPKKEPPRGPLNISDRRVSILTDADNGWVVLNFKDDSERDPIRRRRALPNAVLEAMETAAAENPGADFVVSGETTYLNGQHYLLIRGAEMLEVEKTAPKPAERKPEPEPKKEAPTTQPAGKPKPSDEAPSRESIADMLKDEVPGKPILEPLESEKTVEQTESVAPVTRKPIAATRGKMLINRIGRILPEDDGDWWVWHFRADNNLQEPPLRVLPNEFLGRARKANPRSVRRRSPVEYRITGEVTNYKGRRYLLIRKLLRERDLGRF